MSECEFHFEQWGPPDSGPCGLNGGVAFYGSATFDPKHGPEVQREGTTWDGYVHAGHYVVYASDADRDIVQKVLDSVRVNGSKPPTR